MKSFEDYFSVQIFLIILRETLESAIIISVLLSFIKQSLNQNDVTSKSEETIDYNHATESSSELPNTSSLIASSQDSHIDHTGSENIFESPSQSTAATVIENNEQLNDKLTNYTLYNQLRFQIWAGGICGLSLCVVLGSIIISVFYLLGSDLWALTEHYWEGYFSLLASIVISVMGIKILRVNKMQDKWKWKLHSLMNEQNIFHRAIDQQHAAARSLKKLKWRQRISIFNEKYSMFILPFITTLREGMEAVVFIGGVNLNQPASALPLSVISAIILGISIGLILYRSGNSLSLQYFLIGSTCFLYLVAAGLFSKGVWNLELQDFINKCGGLDVSETGSGPGSYDIFKSVWHVNCCNGETDGGWVLFSGILGWTNSATYGSVISYNFYWIIVISTIYLLMFEEKHGYLPIIPLNWQLKRISKRIAISESVASSQAGTSHENETVRLIRDSIDSSTPLRTNVF